MGGRSAARVPSGAQRAGGTLHEHQQARAFTKQMGEALEAVATGDTQGPQRFREAARQYIALLANHIDKEDNVLFNFGDRVMTDADQQSLCGKFCEVGCQALGGKRREQLQAIADQLETASPSGA